MDAMEPLRPEQYLPMRGRQPGDPHRTIYCIRLGLARGDGSYEVEWYDSKLRRDSALGSVRGTSDVRDFNGTQRIFRMDVPAKCTYAEIDALLQRAVMRDDQLNDIFVPTVQMDLSLSALFRVRPGEDPAPIKASLERAVKRLIEGGLLEAAGAVDSTVWRIDALSSAEAGLDLDTAKAGIQALIDDGEFEEEDMAIRLAKLALTRPAQARAELVERFEAHAQEMRDIADEAAQQGPGGCGA